MSTLEDFENICVGLVASYGRAQVQTSPPPNVPVEFQMQLSVATSAGESGEPYPEVNTPEFQGPAARMARYQAYLLGRRLAKRRLEKISVAANAAAMAEKHVAEASSVVPAAAPPAVRLSLPPLQNYNGSAKDFDVFKYRCDIHVINDPVAANDVSQAINKITCLLLGPAFDWWKGFLDSWDGAHPFQTLEEFWVAMAEAMAPTKNDAALHREYEQLSMTKRFGCTAYTRRFLELYRTLGLSSNVSDRCRHFHRGLSAPIRAALISADEDPFTDFNRLVHRAGRVDSQLNANLLLSSNPGQSGYASVAPSRDPNAMEIDQVTASPASGLNLEQQRALPREARRAYRAKHKLCFFCGSATHSLQKCNLRGASAASSSAVPASKSSASVSSVTAAPVVPRAPVPVANAAKAAALWASHGPSRLCDFDLPGVVLGEYDADDISFPGDSKNSTRW